MQTSKRHTRALPQGEKEGNTEALRKHTRVRANSSVIDRRRVGSAVDLRSRGVAVSRSSAFASAELVSSLATDLCGARADIRLCSWSIEFCETVNICP